MRLDRYLKDSIMPLAVISLVVASSAIAFGQANVFRPDRGFQPIGGYSISQTESVSESTGTVTIRIPIAKLAGRNNLAFSLDLIYNSALYNLQTQNATEQLVMDYNSAMGAVPLNMLNVSGAGGWRYTHSYSLEIDSRAGTPAGTRLTFVAGDGGSHQLWLRVPVAAQNDGDGYSQYDITGHNSAGDNIGPTLTYYTTDGAYIRVEIVVGSGWTARFPNGDYVSGPIVSNNNPKDADQVCDRNANCTHITNTFDGNYTTTTELADDFGRKVVISYGDPRTGAGTDQVLVLPYNAIVGTLPNSLDGSDPRNQVTSPTTTIYWDTISFGPPADVLARNATNGVMYQYQCLSPDGTHDWRCINSFSLRTVSRIQLPTGLSYDFTYADASAPAGEIGQGELRQMKLPSKNGEVARAEVHYTWSHVEKAIAGTSPTFLV